MYMLLCNLCAPLEWLNKITIVITKHILFGCQSRYGIFTFRGPIRLNSAAGRPLVSRSFSMVEGKVGCPCLMSEKQRRIREMSVSVLLQ